MPPLRVDAATAKRSDAYCVFLRFFSCKQLTAVISISLTENLTVLKMRTAKERQAAPPWMERGWAIFI
jgi:hypothetical protein